MSDPMIAALVYADGVYPDQAIGRAIEPLRARGIPLAGAIQHDPTDRPGRHPCDLLLENLATGEIVAIAEHRGQEARGCRLDVGILTDISEAVVTSLHGAEPRLLIVNKFGKIEADGGGMREAIADALHLGIPVLVGVPMRNLDRWRTFAGDYAVELPADPAAIADWLASQGLPVQTAPRQTADRDAAVVG